MIIIEVKEELSFSPPPFDLLESLLKIWNNSNYLKMVDLPTPT